MGNYHLATQPRLFVGLLDGNVVPIAESSNRGLLLRVAADILDEYRDKASRFEGSARGLVYGSQCSRLEHVFAELGLCDSDSCDDDKDDDEEKARC